MSQKTTCRNLKAIMSVHLERKNLLNTQQMEVAVNGPDGATHLILCTGIADLGSVSHKTYTFLVGPRISRRQFVGAIASAAFSSIEIYEKDSIANNTDEALHATLIAIASNYDDESGQLKVRVDIVLSKAVKKLAIGYHVSILAELLSL